MYPVGQSRVAGQLAGAEGRRFYAYDPATDAPLEPAFVAATPELVRTAARAAAEAAPAFARLAPDRHAGLLRRLAANLLASEDALVERARLETAIPAERLRGELARTARQLTLFAENLEAGTLFDPIVDAAEPIRKPTPKPDLRSLRRPLGPVAIFGASNFPFAYSVLGCDTAAAIAAGCPVLVKAHPAHPGTSALCGAIADATLRELGLPSGFFSLIFDDGHAIGAALVTEPDVRAVAFTGSLRGGRALMDLAAARSHPIPVYAEMGANNPVVLLPGALAERGETLARDLAHGITHGAGQFCTKPGLLIALAGEATDRFAGTLAAHLDATAPTVMLTRGIFENYRRLVAERGALPRVIRLARGRAETTASNAGVAELFATDAHTFRSTSALAEEIFGPTSLLVILPDAKSLPGFIAGLEGALAGAIHAGPSDADLAAETAEALAARVGRVAFNGPTTGVEVSPAIVHGGPYPATSDGRTSSVGTTAALRFTRRVCYQNFPESLLPEALRRQDS